MLLTALTSVNNENVKSTALAVNVLGHSERDVNGASYIYRKIICGMVFPI